MTICINTIRLKDVSDTISILTPIVLLIWFIYSQRQTLSKRYFDELIGIYAGFPEPIQQPKNKGAVTSGIIMNIRNIESTGYFLGDFDYREIESIDKVLTDGFYPFYGKMRFRILKNKKRNPFKLDENRVYYGKFYVVMRLDFNAKSNSIENYLTAEYDIIHYRERQTLEFTLNKKYNQEQSFPEVFTLYKKTGFTFEPYRGVKRIVFFGGESRVDKP